MKSDHQKSPEYELFTNLVDKVLSVPKSEMDRRMEEYKRQSMQKEVRPGPKPKNK